MANSNSTPNNRPMVLTAVDISALADRLAARGASLLVKDQPEITTDMALASRTLRRLMKLLQSVHLIANTETVQLID
jgi:hypothetical protein